MEAWEVLLPRALEILEGVGPDTFWTMGGGTVLMLRHNHRASKDVDIFFRDPQPLGYVNPRLGGAAERMTSQYEESSGHVKLYFKEGEIDFVASPLLTSPGFGLRYAACSRPQDAAGIGCGNRREENVASRT